jgi:outer membrane receptor protein involved in Fe transport
MRVILFAILFVFASGAVWSQRITIKGMVFNTQETPIVGAYVILEDNQSGTATDMNGAFQLSCEAKDAVLTVKNIGYLEEKITLSKDQVLAAQSTPLIIHLTQDKLSILVISAGKFEQNLNEVTVSMEVLRPELLRDKNVVSADEALQQTPGVSIVDKEPQIRSGSGYSFGAGSRVQILVDDMPTLSGDAGRPNWDYLPVENISQIEVIKGASSVLYGSAALSGVIHVRTAYPTSKPRTIVNAYHGVYSDPRNSKSQYWTSSLQRSGINFMHAQKIGQLDMTISGNIVGDDGHLGPIKDSLGNFTDGYNPFTVDRYNANSRARLSANLGWHSKKVEGLYFGLNTNWNVSNSLATLLWEHSDSALYSAYDGSATRTKQLLGTVDPFVNYAAKNGDKHALRTRWQSLDNNNDNNQGNFSDQFYAEYQYQHTLHENLKMTTGIVSIYTNARGQLFTGGNPDGHNTAQNQAAYLQLDSKLFERLNISAGVRYEQFKINEKSDGKPVFRAGLNYQIAEATFARASFGQGYRFPSIAEKFIITGVGAINIFANPDLVAETSNNMEIGIKQGFRIGNFQGYADVAAFRQEYNNFIEFTFGQWKYVQPLQGIADLARFQNELTKSIGFKSVNTGKAKITGAECSLMGEGKIGRVKIQMLAGYTYTLPISLTPHHIYGESPNGGDDQFKIPSTYTYTTTSSDTANHILKYRMQHLVRADMGFTYRRWQCGFSARYNSHMQNIDRAFEDLESVPTADFSPGIRAWRSEHTTGDYVFDLRCGFEWKEGHRIMLIVNNLLNREYAIRPLAIEEPRFTMLQYVMKF